MRCRTTHFRGGWVQYPLILVSNLRRKFAQKVRQGGHPASEGIVGLDPQTGCEYASTGPSEKRCDQAVAQAMHTQVSTRTLHHVVLLSCHMMHCDCKLSILCQYVACL